MTAPPAGRSVLLVFFSRPGENYWEGGRRDLEVGNTKVLAEMITERIDCETYEIRAANPYPEAYDPTVERNRQEQADDARPEIQGELPDLSAYDTVILASPIWNVCPPMIMHTFAEQADLTGKRVLPVVTYAVSELGRTVDVYTQLLPGSDLGTALAVQGEEVADSVEQVEEWIADAGL